MKIEQQPQQFQPITITLESQEDVQAMTEVCRIAVGKAVDREALNLADTIWSHLAITARTVEKC